MSKKKYKIYKNILTLLYKKSIVESMYKIFIAKIMQRSSK